MSPKMPEFKLEREICTVQHVVGHHSNVITFPTSSVKSVDVIITFCEFEQSTSAK